jgi:hypothetical protein
MTKPSFTPVLRMRAIVSRAFSGLRAIVRSELNVHVIREDGIWPAGSILRDRRAHSSDTHTEFRRLNYDLFLGHRVSYVH